MNEADSSFQNWMKSHEIEFSGQRVNLQRDMRSAYMAGRDSLFGDSTVSSPEYQAWQANKNAKARATMDSMPYAHLKDNGDGTLTFMNPVPYPRLAQPKTCEHCKHWKANTDYSDVKYCWNEAVKKYMVGGRYATLEPPPDFGCLRFEEKE